VREAASLVVDPANPQARKLAAQAHPDVAIVRRGLKKDGKGYMGEISVDVARKALDLFAATAGSGGWRICIVDSADDLNNASANALLKVIEEPPPRSLFLIVAHQPARTLATIRSRCRKLALRPLDESDVRLVLQSLGTEASSDDLARAASLAQGSVRRALALMDPALAGLIATVRAMLERLPDLDPAALYRLAEQFAKRDAEAAFELMRDVVLGWIGERIAADAGQGARVLAPLVEVWEKSARAAREAESYNLDRRPLVISLFGDLAEAVRHHRAA
jgi:DNA polymerase-3 subunit delta'